MFNMDKILELSQGERTISEYGHSVVDEDSIKVYRIPCMFYTKSTADVDADNVEALITQNSIVFVNIYSPKPGEPVPRNGDTVRILDRSGEVIHDVHEIVAVATRGGNLGIRKYLNITLRRSE